MPDFNKIEMFPVAHYEVDVFWDALERTVAYYQGPNYAAAPLNLMPDFQRGHVWTDEQRAAYVEHVLRGGETGKVLVFNHTHWDALGDATGASYVIVDGLQRLTAVRKFLAGELPVMGAKIDKWTGHMRLHCGFKWRILSLKTRAEVLRYYLAFNAGGTAHAPSEIERVRGLLTAEETPRRARAK